MEYSKTSNNGPSEKRTTSVQRTAHLPPIDTFRTSEKRTPLNSEQRTLTSPQRTLANTKLPPKKGQRRKCGRLSTAFVTPPLLDSKIEHYSCTTAHRASLSCRRKATERSENATSSCSTITDYHAYRKYTKYL